MSVLGDMAHICAAGLDACLGNILAAEGDLSAAALFKTAETVDKLGLTVAVDTCNADDLACADIEGNIVYGVFLADSGGNAESLNGQDGFRGLGCGLVDLQLNGTADHHIAELLLVGVFGFNGAHILAFAQNGDTVGNGHNLVELMGDEEDALAFCGKALHSGHQLVDLLRSENCGGLVENEDVVVAVKHLQNFNALLHTDGDVFDLGVKVNVKTVLLAYLLNLFAGFLFLQKAHPGGLCAKDDVIHYGEYIYQLEVLMDHSYSQCSRIIGIVDFNNFAVFADLAFFGLIESEQNTHKSGFAGAVFAQQGVDFASLELQSYVVIRSYSGEFLGDVKHLYYIRRAFHTSHPLSSFSFGP